MKQIASIALPFIFSLFLLACNKESEEVIEKIPGTFTATINGATWEPTQYSAVYFPRRRALHILAKGNDRQLICGIQLDGTSAIKTYVLQSQGNHVARLQYEGFTYSSDQNVADAGGSLQLQKLDTTGGSVSAILNFTGYSPTRKKLVFSAQTISDIPLKIDTTSNDGNSAACTVAGANMASWQSTEVWAGVTCISNFVNKTMQVEIASVIGGFPNRRHLLFYIPLNLPVGTYPILPNMPPYFYCGRLDVTSRYTIDDYANAYFATSGSFTIRSIDTAARTMTASFSLAVKDTTTRQETIQISNGELRVNRWFER